MSLPSVAKIMFLSSYRIALLQTKPCPFVEDLPNPISDGFNACSENQTENSGDLHFF